MNQSRSIYSFGAFRLDTGQQVLLRDGHPVPLKPKEFQLLAVLVQNNGQVISKHELMKQLWPDTFVEDNNLTVSIFKLRRTLGEERNGDSYIETVPRRGYRFASCVGEASQRSAGLFVTPTDPVLASGSRQGNTKRSIAVLPFKPIGAKGDAYLGLGMADALITKLSNLGQVTVRPTSSVRKYGGAEDPVSVGSEGRVGTRLTPIVEANTHANATLRMVQSTYERRLESETVCRPLEKAHHSNVRIARLVSPSAANPAVIAPPTRNTVAAPTLSVAQPVTM